MEERQRAEARERKEKGTSWETKVSRKLSFSTEGFPRFTEGTVALLLTKSKIFPARCFDHFCCMLPANIYIHVLLVYPN